ncbi:hypothetical protein P9112_001964 [Eukaryota sp. TZLM1-RC]
MGLLYRCCCSCKSEATTNITLALFGIDNAGKTTAFNTLRGDTHSIIAPTVGFDTGSFLHKRTTSITLFDVGGGPKIRDIWQHYYPEIHGVLFFIDGSDPDRLNEAKQVLMNSLGDKHLAHKPLLILVNKQDVDSALSAEEVASKLELNLFNSDFSILPSIALPTTQGYPHQELLFAVDWIVERVLNNFDELELRIENEKEEYLAEQRLKRAEKRKKIEQELNNDN